MQNQAIADFGGQLLALRLAGQWSAARHAIRARPDFAASPRGQRLLREHDDAWWQPIVGRRVTLRRRGPEHLEFVRACWADVDFMRKFNRMARPLPADDAAVRAILAREHAALIGESRALHWTIEAAGEPIGFVSATEISLAQRRCEFLIGLRAQRPSPVPVEAAHLAVAFLRRRAGIERLTAYFYADNAYAAKVAEKFGFRREGVLRGYMRDPDGTRSDLIVAGLLLTQPDQARTTKVLGRLFPPAA